MTNDSVEIRPASHPVIVEKELSYEIVAAFYQVYNSLGYGFTEPVYVKALVVAPQQRGLRVELEVPATVVFEGVEVGHFRMDMLVERVIIEVKSTERISDVPKREVRNYLKATNLELGLLLHFGPRAEVHRILNPRGASGPGSHSNNSNDSDA